VIKEIEKMKRRYRTKGCISKAAKEMMVVGNQFNQYILSIFIKQKNYSLKKNL